MNTQLIEIHIIDTMNNERSLFLESTEKTAPRLIYNGGDDRFDVLFTSEFSFNMLVDTSEEAAFFHLFTGNETRYLVQLRDVTDAANVVVLWDGHLLPEQFSEPYINGSFFVEFLATDGIGRLKSKRMDDAFYNEKKTVPQFISECLKKTGLNMPLKIAPAIQNAVLDLTVENMQVEGIAFVDKDKKFDCYKVLKGLVVSLGCRLFQWQGCWHLVGINRAAETELPVEFYDVDGVFVEKQSVFRSVLSQPFFANPTIKINPPLQEVNVTWSKNERKNLLPEQAIEYFIPEGEDRTPLHWKAVSIGDCELRMAGWFYELDLDNIAMNVANAFNYYNAPHIPSPNAALVDPMSYLNIEGSVQNFYGLQANYATLIDPVYIESSRTDVVTNVKFELEMHIPLNGYTDTEELKELLKDEVFNDTFYFQMMFKRYKTQPDADEEIFVSNIPRTGVDVTMYDFKMKVVEPELKYQDARLVATLKLDEIPILRDGYYSIRLHPMMSKHAYFREWIVVTKLVFDYPAEKEEVNTKRRAIDFTTKEDVGVFHSAAEMNLSKRRFLINKEFDVVGFENVSETIEIPQVYFERKGIDIYGTGIISWYNIYFGISDASFALINDANTTLFVQKGGQGEMTQLFNVMIQRMGNLRTDGNFTGYIIYQIDMPTVVVAGDYKLQQNDKLFVKTNVINNTDYEVNYPAYFLSKWRRWERQEEEPYLNILNRIYHDTVKGPKFVLNGSYAQLVSPLELVQFTYRGSKNYIPTKIALNLSEGLTELTIVDSLSENVNDYE